jgi:pyruvate kinase
MEVDYIALSFVRTEDDLKQIKAIIQKQGKDIPVIAKIEKPEAVDNLTSILEVADGIMVARGDLGVEMHPEQVPTIQKKIIHAAAEKNKPVITATQMLESMTTNLMPTRAEASDVANAILDGTDAVMLSAETATGKYPVKSVQMMSKIALQAERSTFMRYNVLHEKDLEETVTQAVAQSAVNILHELGAKGIVVFSASGSTSKLISKHRPSSPVFAFTPRMDIYSRLSLLWGITPLHINEIQDTNRLVQTSEDILIEKKLFKKGDLIVIVIGKGLKKGSTNLIKIHRIGYDD